MLGKLETNARTIVGVCNTELCEAIVYRVSYQLYVNVFSHRMTLAWSQICGASDEATWYAGVLVDQV